MCLEGQWLCRCPCCDKTHVFPGQNRRGLQQQQTICTKIARCTPRAPKIICESEHRATAATRSMLNIECKCEKKQKVNKVDAYASLKPLAPRKCSFLQVDDIAAPRMRGNYRPAGLIAQAFAL